MVLETAIKTALEARDEWDQRPLKEKVDVVLRAADLVCGKYRADLVASCMLGQVGLKRFIRCPSHTVRPRLSGHVRTGTYPNKRFGHMVVMLQHM